jgi:hypothetical protein
VSKNTLHTAKTNKKDEFYTQLADIERELKHYKEYFKNKVVYCNCDDPRSSNFFHYFSYNFEKLKLKKLISSCYKSKNFDLFSQNDSEEAIYLEYTGDKNQNFIPDDNEIGIKTFKGDGDFRSEESIKLLKESDIVVTNPPFSVFREYVKQLIDFEKSFLIIGSLNAINYKEIFKLFLENKIWIGNGFKSGNAFFKTPHAKEFAKGVYDPVTDLVKFRNVNWFTNLEIQKRNEELVLYKNYNEDEYVKYDNYDAININRLVDIPLDYIGIMGVPITFLNQYNPLQFEILGLSQKVGMGLESTRKYDEFFETRQDGSRTGSSGKKTNGNPVIKGKPKKGNYYVKGDEIVHSLYGRIFIKHRKS